MIFQPSFMLKLQKKHNPSKIPPLAEVPTLTIVHCSAPTCSHLAKQRSKEKETRHMSRSKRNELIRQPVKSACTASKTSAHISSSNQGQDRYTAYSSYPSSKLVGIAVTV